MANVPGYVANTFTAGQQPTTTVWNELWSNDAAFNSFLTGANITSSLMATGALNKLFQFRTTNQTQGASASQVAYNGFSSTYSFNAITGHTYQIHLVEPSMGTSGGSGAWDIFIYPYINGTQVGEFHESMTNTGVGFAVNQSTYWQAGSTGSVSLTIQYASDGGATGFSCGASSSAPALLVVNEFA